MLRAVTEAVPAAGSPHTAGPGGVRSTPRVRRGAPRPSATWPRRFGHLIAAGLPAEAAVGAASWAVRAFLGLTGLTEGTLADITVHDADPRRERAVLRHPRHIVPRGLVVR